MSNGLGLSIGQTNLVAVPAGRPPLSRRAILSLYPGNVDGFVSNGPGQPVESKQ